MAKRRICVVITARPSYSRIRTALRAIAEHKGLELQLVVAGSALLDRYGGVVSEIQGDGFSVSERVAMLLEGEDPIAMAKTTGLGVIELAGVFNRLKPDFVVTIADRYETIATAIAASYLNMPVVHVQGGEITGSIDEKVRHAITKLANLHLVSTKQAADRVVKMGEPPETVYRTGCPSIDLAADVANSDELGYDLFKNYGGVGPRFDLSGGFLVVLQHPVTTEHDSAYRHADETLAAVSSVNLPALWFWPNPDAGSDGTSKAIRVFRERHPEANLHLFRNLAPMDFLRLINKCSCLVGNSSVGIREASFLGVPTVNIGSRQRGRDRGKNVVDVSHNRDEIAEGIRGWLGKPRPERDVLYGDGRAGQRIAAILAEAEATIEKRLAY